MGPSAIHSSEGRKSIAVRPCDIVLEPTERARSSRVGIEEPRRRIAEHHPVSGVVPFGPCKSQLSILFVAPGRPSGLTLVNMVQTLEVPDQFVFVGKERLRHGFPLHHHFCKTLHGYEPRILR